MLAQHNLDTSTLRSKGWEEFAHPDAPKMDFILTVCDQAAGEQCPAWPGQPITGHWGFSDPAAVTESDAAQWAAFNKAYHEIGNRLRIFLSLPLNKLDRIRCNKRCVPSTYLHPPNVLNETWSRCLSCTRLTS